MCSGTSSNDCTEGIGASSVDISMLVHGWVGSYYVTGHKVFFEKNPLVYFFRISLRRLKAAFVLLFAFLILFPVCCRKFEPYGCSFIDLFRSHFGSSNFAWLHSASPIGVFSSAFKHRLPFLLN